MIKFENTEVMNWPGAIRGMRNPLNSWDKSDSDYCTDGGSGYCEECGRNCDGYYIGDNDLALMKKLIKAGSDHRKFMRQILVSVDITSNSVWWAEFDTYKVGTVRNSCSKMHKIHAKEFTADDFSHEGISEVGSTTKSAFNIVLGECEYLRQSFNLTKEKKYWRALIELLPSGYNLRATVTLNYEVLRNIYGSRRNHKLDEWSVGFMDWIRSLPYSELITDQEVKND